MSEENIFSSNFIRVCTANFLLYMTFFMMMPILPLYLSEEFQATSTFIGVILSSYTITALTIRPITGFMLDRLPRRGLYLIIFILYVLSFLCYTVAATILLFFVVRALHGFTFGAVSVASNTMATDIIPEQHRGRGLGLFGVTTSIAMSLGPSVSLYMRGHGWSYNAIFLAIVTIGILGFCIATTVRQPQGVVRKRRSFNIYNLLLIKAMPEATMVSLLSFGYGIVTAYLAIYAKTEVGMESGSGLFFTFLAFGLICSRLMSGIILSRGRFTRILSLGILLIAVGYGMLAFLHQPILFFLSALCLGFGYGIVTPTSQTMIVNIGDSSQRGIANATYLTFFDVGVGLGVMLGGVLATHYSYSLSYAVSMTLVLVALTYLKLYVERHFNTTRLR